MQTVQNILYDLLPINRIGNLRKYKEIFKRWQIKIQFRLTRTQRWPHLLPSCIHLGLHSQAIFMFFISICRKLNSTVCLLLCVHVL